MNTVAIFKMVIQASWQSSVVLVALLLLRPLLETRIPAAWRTGSIRGRPG